MAYDFLQASGQFLSTPWTDIGHPVSMACWFNADNATANYTMIGVTDDAAGGTIDGWFLSARGAEAGDPVKARTVVSGSEASAATSTGFSAGTWHHACGTFSSGNNRTAYIDGGSAVTDAIDPGAPAGIDTVNIGCRSSVEGAAMNGLIAEVGIWDAVLTAAEVASLARGCSPLLIRPSLLLFYAPLARDLVVRKGGHTLTNNGSATVANHPRILYPHRRGYRFKSPVGGGGGGEGGAAYHYGMMEVLNQGL